MLLQTNSYVVPREKRAEHARLMVRFRQCFKRLGSVFEVYEQTGENFTSDGGGRFVQIMRFRDRHHQQEVHEKEQQDPVAQQLIADFCQLVNISYQQQHGLFAATYYAGILPDRPSDKPELLVDSEAQDTIGKLGDEVGPPMLPAAEPTVEEAFAPYLEPDSSEYPVQQLEPLEEVDSYEPPGAPASATRRARQARPANS